MRKYDSIGKLTNNILLGKLPFKLHVLEILIHLI